MALGLALVVTSLSGSTAANAAAAPAAAPGGDTVAAIQQAWDYVPQYLSAPVIASGRVVAADGHAVTGATVILFPVLRAPAAGTVLPPLARAVSGADGRYTLHLPAGRDAALANRFSGGALNLHIMAFYPGAVGDWFVPIPAGQHAVASPAQITLRATTETYSAAPAGGVPGNCSPISKAKSIGPVPQVVGYKSSLDPKLVSADFSYSTGYTVTTGVGFSASGKYGGLSASGTSTTSDTETIDYKPLPGKGSNYYEADSVWTWQKYQCFYPGGHGGGYYIDRWYLTEDSVGGSAGTPGAKAVKAKYCYSSTNLKSVTEDHSTQKTWSGGADLKGLGFDINLSSQDGYTTAASLTYNFNYKIGDYPPYCGVDGYPGTKAAEYVQVHK